MVDLCNNCLNPLKERVFRCDSLQVEASEAPEAPKAPEVPKVETVHEKAKKAAEDLAKKLAEEKEKPATKEVSARRLEAEHIMV
ncbi:unnamed protein product [Cladocopium goreaui]|uniref:Uncharacterized protein n=1 Tax=Cladocopium goreaui TaxID=2562237 RepID=A0A9P1DX02_9DINO|nr:unnamed protein product [Cladocopium goreaui]